MLADSTENTERKRRSTSKSDRPQKTRKNKQKRTNKKRKKHFSDSSSSDSESDIDLNVELKSIDSYVKQRTLMVDEMFNSISSRKLRHMLPTILQSINVDDLKTLCLGQLEVMSKKRIRRILAGDDPYEISSSGTEDSTSEEEEVINVEEITEVETQSHAVDSTSHDNDARGVFGEGGFINDDEDAGQISSWSEGDSDVQFVSPHQSDHSVVSLSDTDEVSSMTSGSEEGELVEKDRDDMSQENNQEVIDELREDLVPGTERTCEEKEEIVETSEENQQKNAKSKESSPLLRTRTPSTGSREGTASIEGSSKAFSCVMDEDTNQSMELVMANIKIKTEPLDEEVTITAIDPGNEDYVNVHVKSEDESENETFGNDVDNPLNDKETADNYANTANVNRSEENIEEKQEKRTENSNLDLNNQEKNTQRIESLDEIEKMEPPIEVTSSISDTDTPIKERHANVSESEDDNIEIIIKAQETCDTNSLLNDEIEEKIPANKITKSSDFVSSSLNSDPAKNQDEISISKSVESIKQSRSFDTRFVSSSDDKKHTTGTSKSSFKDHSVKKSQDSSNRKVMVAANKASMQTTLQHETRTVVLSSNQQESSSGSKRTVIPAKHIPKDGEAVARRIVLPSNRPETSSSRLLPEEPTTSTHHDLLNTNPNRHVLPPTTEGQPRPKRRIVRPSAQKQKESVPSLSDKTTAPDPKPLKPSGPLPKRRILVRGKSATSKKQTFQKSEVIEDDVNLLLSQTPVAETEGAEPTEHRVVMIKQSTSNKRKSLEGNGNKNTKPKLSDDIVEDGKDLSKMEILELEMRARAIKAMLMNN